MFLTGLIVLYYRFSLFLSGFMALRPAKCYRDGTKRPFTRAASKVQRKNFVGAIPGNKIRQFNAGNGAENFDTVLDMITMNPAPIIIRDNALEAARITITQHLTKKFKKEGFFMKVRAYPHHVLRENKQAQGAGADRVSTGMSHSYGKNIGRGAIVRKGKILYSVLIYESNALEAKKEMMKVKSKLPLDVTVLIHKDVASIGTKPTKMKLTKAEKEELTEGTEEAKTEEKPEEKGKEAAKAPAGKTPAGKPAVKGKEPEKKEKKKPGKK